MLLVALMIFNLYSFCKGVTLEMYLPFHGFTLALYFFLGLLEDYYTCKSGCMLTERSIK